MCIVTGVANGNGVSSLLLILGMNLLYYVPLIVLIVLGICALLKYLRAGKGDPAVRRSLGEALKAHRMKSNMTQEFVAESLGVSRQAVSKWETGVSRS